MTGKGNSTVKNVVLVHGGFVDGSGWEEVYKILKNDGYNVSVVQHPTISFEDGAVRLTTIPAESAAGAQFYRARSGGVQRVGL